MMQNRFQLPSTGRPRRSHTLGCLLFVGSVLLTTGSSALAQDPLPRRAFFGAAFEMNTTDSGINVTHVFENSSAAEAGLALGDVVERVDGEPVASVEALATTIGNHQAGDIMRFELRRNNQPVEMSVELFAYPSEEIDGCDVIYDAVPSPDSELLRTIVARPTGDGPFPAVLMIQGLGCTSIDSPFPEYHDVILAILEKWIEGLRPQ